MNELSHCVGYFYEASLIHAEVSVCLCILYFFHNMPFDSPNCLLWVIVKNVTDISDP